MSFDLQKYLTENNLTLISRIREDDDDSMEDKEPTKADVKADEKKFRGIDKKKKEYANLQAQMKKILAKHAVRKPDGKLTVKDVAGYKKEVGTLPDDLKRLKQQIDQVENPKLDSDEED